MSHVETRTTTPNVADRLTAWLRTLATLALLSLFVWAGLEAREFRRGAELFPMVMCAIGAALCLFELIRQLIHRSRSQSPAISTADLSLDDDDRTLSGYWRSLSLFGWLLFWAGLTYLLGLPVATLIWIPLLLWRRFATPWLISIAIAGALVAVMWILRQTLNMAWPTGILF